MPIHHPLLDPLNWVVLAQSHENVSNATAQKDTRLMCCALTSGYSEGVAVYLRAGIQSLREEVKGQGFTPGYLYLCICEVEDLEIAGYAISETKRILESTPPEGWNCMVVNPFDNLYAELVQKATYFIPEDEVVHDFLIIQAKTFEE